MCLIRPLILKTYALYKRNPKNILYKITKSIFFCINVCSTNVWQFTIHVWLPSPIRWYALRITSVYSIRSCRLCIQHAVSVHRERANKHERKIEWVQNHAELSKKRTLYGLHRFDQFHPFVFHKRHFIALFKACITKNSNKNKLLSRIFLFVWMWCMDVFHIALYIGRFCSISYLSLLHKI